jgi:type I restriction enzyme S subunit
VREDSVISSNHRFFSGQIVYSKIRPNLAKVVVVSFDGLCSADMYPIDALIDPHYLQRYMLSESFLVQAVKTDTRVAMPKINQAELNVIAVPVPPLAEQRRIVAKVEELMALVDALETQLAASRTIGKELLAALVAELTAGKESCANA